MRIITGKARGLKLSTPKNMDVRPTSDRVKEALFSIIGVKIIEAKVLDLFAGTGNLGLEAWSRGASEIVFCDENKESLRLVGTNVAKCRAENEVTIIKGNAVQLIEILFNKQNQFDFVFCDPPYNKGFIQKIIEKIDAFPIIKDGGYLIIEHAQHEIFQIRSNKFEVIREEKYGETLISFIKFAK